MLVKDFYVTFLTKESTVIKYLQEYGLLLYLVQHNDTNVIV